MANPEKNRRFTFTATEAVANNFEHEAQLAGLSVPDYFKRAVGTYVLIKSVQRDIEAHFEDGAELTYGITVGATDGTTIKAFSIQPDLENPGSSVIIPLEEY